MTDKETKKLKRIYPIVKKSFLLAFGQYLRAPLQRLNRFKSKLGNKTTDYLTVFSFTLCNCNAKLQLSTARDKARQTMRHHFGKSLRLIVQSGM